MLDCRALIRHAWSINTETTTAGETCGVVGHGFFTATANTRVITGAAHYTRHDSDWDGSGDGGNVRKLLKPSGTSLERAVASYTCVAPTEVTYGEACTKSNKINITSIITTSSRRYSYGWVVWVQLAVCASSISSTVGTAVTRSNDD